MLLKCCFVTMLNFKYTLLILTQNPVLKIFEVSINNWTVAERKNPCSQNFEIDFYNRIFKNYNRIFKNNKNYAIIKIIFLKSTNSICDILFLKGYECERTTQSSQYITAAVSFN